jgi:Protein of unknown function (DUF3223)
MPIDLATISFPTQSAAAKFFRDMTWRYQDCQRINDADAQHLAALLEWHSERDEKIGAGVDHFEVAWADFGTRCFCIVRRDGTLINFSYRHCIQCAGRARRRTSA